MSVKNLRVHYAFNVYKHHTSLQNEVIRQIRRIRPYIPDEKQTATGNMAKITASYDVSLGTLTTKDG